MKSILECIHQTPLFELGRPLVRPDMSNIFAKLEAFNPMGSIKDRICWNMLEAAISEGQLQLDNPSNPPTVIEATSGNTGLGLAMVCAAKKIRLIIVMPKNYSLERRFLLKQLGAEVILTSAEGEMPEAITQADEIAKKTPNSFIPKQFSNPHNPEVHKQQTFPEILADLKGEEIDAFVAGVGTSGTLTGVGRALKKHNPQALLIAVEPEKCAVLSGQNPGVHEIQGIGAGFIPENYRPELVDQILKVDDDDAFNSAKALASHYGLLVGVSSGANFFAASQIAKKLGPDKNVVTVFCDKGERYFSVEKFAAQELN